MSYFYTISIDQESIVRVPMTRVATGDKQLISDSFPLYRIFKSLFLPQGYPDSVSEDYINYQIWDTIQAFCSTINGMWFDNIEIALKTEYYSHCFVWWFVALGTLSTHAILKGVGVGNDYANALSATITWVQSIFLFSYRVQMS